MLFYKGKFNKFLKKKVNNWKKNKIKKKTDDLKKKSIKNSQYWINYTILIFWIIINNFRYLKTI
jgi:hypothetical protein